MDLNATRFEPTTRGGHVESYFFKINDPSCQRALWLKATIFASTTEPERPLAEGWAIAFDRRGSNSHPVAVKHTLPYELAAFSRAGLGIHWKLPERADELSMEERRTRGRISRRDHSIAWNLEFTGTARPLVPFPYESMYGGRFPRTKTCTPLPDARFDGEILVDGERWEVEGWRGMQGHNWGLGHAEHYAWCHANLWEEDDSFILEGMSARVRVGPLRTPLLTLISVRHRGVAYDFNSPLDLVRATGDIGLRRFAFSASNSRARIEGELEAGTDDFVGLYYPNPDGPMTYCLNSKLARARVRFEAKGSARLALTTRAAALEIGTRDEDHGVRMYV